MPKVNKRVSFKKCRRCRYDKQKCLPEERVWPGTRCNRCQRFDYICSASETKPEEDSGVPDPALPGPTASSIYAQPENSQLSKYSPYLQKIGDLRQILGCYDCLKPYTHVYDIGIKDATYIHECLVSQLEKAILYLEKQAEQLICDGRYADAEYLHAHILNHPQLRSHASNEPLRMETIIRLVSLYEQLGNYPAAEATQENLVRELAQLAGTEHAKWHGFLSAEIEKLLRLYGLFYRRVRDMRIDYHTPSDGYRDLAQIVLFQRAADLDISEVNQGPQSGDDNTMGLPDCGRYKLALHMAIAKGAINMAKYLLFRTDSVPRADSKDAYGATALHVAVQHCHMGILHLFLKANTNMNAQNADGRTPLHMASVMEEAEILIPLLIEGGADIGVQDNERQTALHLAVRTGRRNGVEALLRKGADVDMKTRAGKSALHVAVEEGHGSIVEILLRSGADLEAKTRARGTALHLAAYAGADLIVKLLLEAADERDTKAKGSATDIVQSSASRACKKYNLVEARDKSRKTALHIAVEGHHQSVTEVLLQGGANVDAQDKFVRTSLHLATATKNEEMARVLVNANARLERKDGWGCTPLHNAVIMKSEALVKLLISKGVDVNAGDDAKKTPLLRAACGGLQVERGRGRGNFSWDAKLKEMSYPSSEGYSSMVKLLLIHGAQLEAQGAHGETALLLAVENGEQDTVEYLLHAGADVNTKDSSERSALHAAVARGSEQLLDLLLRSAARSDAQDVFGDTPLQIAMAKGYDEAVNILRSRMAS